MTDPYGPDTEERIVTLQGPSSTALDEWLYGVHGIIPVAIQQGPGPDTEERIVTHQGPFSKTPEEWLKYGSRGIIPVVRAQGAGPDIEIPRLFMDHSSYFSEPFSGFNYWSRIRKPWTIEWTEIVDEYKKSIKQKYIQHKDQHLLFGAKASLGDLYTEPDIIQKSKSGGYRNVCVNELLGSKAPWHKPVILHGASGSGKSVIAQKIMLDWASGKCYLNFHLVFYLKYEELKCISEEINLFELLSWRSNLPSHVISQMLLQSSCNVLFLIDGFDECRLLYHEYSMLHVSKKAPPEVIVCALLRGEILFSSTLLVTTRTEVIKGTMLKRPQRFTKIVGFSEKKIQEYFQKFFQDEKLFRKVFESVKSNETLLTACTIPVICWIICTVIRERFNDGADLTRGLETATSIYVEFVSTVLEHHCQGLNESVPNLLRSLGQLAERGMLEQQVLFDEKTINETVLDPACNPFLEKVLLKKRIQQETMFRFIHFSFQKFFTALYFVLLDEDESQKKVRELLHTVERGWALSSWSAADFSIADSEIRSSKQFQSVILFLCGLCKNKTHSFFKKHNVTVSINIKTQLKEWIHQCSLRYQHENMMFILHCLYELHERNFIGKVLRDLILDLSNILLNKTDCWLLGFCLQCCKRIRNLRLNVTSDHLKILQPALCSCEELWLKVDSFSEVENFFLALGERKNLHQLIIKVNEKRMQRYSEIIASAKDGDLTLSVGCSKSKRTSPQLISKLTLTCSLSETQILQKLQRLPSFGGSDKVFLIERLTLLEILQSVSGLKKIHLQVESWTDKWVSTILSLTQTCPNLNELGINATFSVIPLTLPQSLMKSLGQTDWTVRVWRKSVLIERDRKSLTEEKLKTEKRPNSESKKDDTLDSVSCVSLGAESSSAGQSCSENTEVFTPKYIDQDEIKGTNTHRFVSPHAGQFQCSLTNLAFVMEGKGEVLYKIVPWDPRLLDGLGQMKLAGPLYNIECFEGSISQLHLPHCEILSEENKVSLAVAHITGDNVEVLQPLKVSSTHVIINITEFSLFGLIKKIIYPELPVRSQVLFFVRQTSVKQKEKILDVHLLPRNVPVSEVKIQHKENRHIQTSSKCRLTPGREYSLCCLPEGLKVQPENELFEFDFDPNFHPTFEVILDVNIEEIKLSLLDKTDEEKTVWTPRQIFFTESGSSTDSTAIIKDTESEFVDNNRDELIQRVTSVMEIADCLRSKKMITDEMWSEVHAENTHRKQMRILYMVLISGGSAVKAEFYKLLKEKEPHLVESLESSSSTSAQ